MAWAQQYDLAVTGSVQGAANQPHGRRILPDAAGNIYIAGRLSGTLAIGLTPLFGGPGSVFVAKMAPTSVWLWATVSKENNNDTVNDFAMDAGGNLYLTGNFLSRTIQFGTTTLTNANIHPNVAHNDGYVAKLDPAGQRVRATHGGSEEDEQVGGLALISTGSVYSGGLARRDRIGSEGRAPARQPTRAAHCPAHHQPPAPAAGTHLYLPPRISTTT